jgi:hypothetical protein
MKFKFYTKAKFNKIENKNTDNLISVNASTIYFEYKMFKIL